MFMSKADGIGRSLPGKRGRLQWYGWQQIAWLFSNTGPFPCLFWHHGTHLISPLFWSKGHRHSRQHIIWGAMCAELFTKIHSLALPSALPASTAVTSVSSWWSSRSSTMEHTAASASTVSTPESTRHFVRRRVDTTRRQARNIKHVYTALAQKNESPNYSRLAMKQSTGCMLLLQIKCHAYSIFTLQYVDDTISMTWSVNKNNCWLCTYLCDYFSNSSIFRRDSLSVTDA